MMVIIRVKGQGEREGRQDHRQQECSVVEHWYVCVGYCWFYGLQCAGTISSFVVSITGLVYRIIKEYELYSERLEVIA